MVTRVGDDVVFSASRLKLLGFLVLGVLMTGTCVFVVQKGLAARGSFKEAAVWFGVPFFALCTLVILARLLRAGATVSIGPAGIRDVRFSPDIVPWSAVVDVEGLAMHGQRMLLMKLDPAFEQGIRKTRLVRAFGAINAALGYGGLSVSAQGLDGSFDDLVLAVIKHWRPRKPV